MVTSGSHHYNLMGRHLLQGNIEKIQLHHLNRHLVACYTDKTSSEQVLLLYIMHFCTFG